MRAAILQLLRQGYSIREVAVSLRAHENAVRDVLLRPEVYLDGEPPSGRPTDSGRDSLRPRRSLLSPQAVERKAGRRQSVTPLKRPQHVLEREHAFYP